MRRKHRTFSWEDLADELIELAISQNIESTYRSEISVAQHLSAMHRTGLLSERTRSLPVLERVHGLNWCADFCAQKATQHAGSRPS